MLGVVFHPGRMSQEYCICASLPILFTDMSVKCGVRMMGFGAKIGWMLGLG